MGALLEIGASIISHAERRAEIAGQNISNITTPGYKRCVSFDRLLASEDGVEAQSIEQSVGTDFSAGKQVDTGNPDDLTIQGQGFFVVQGPDGPLYTRAGQFQRDAEGRLVTAQGFALQTDTGADVQLKTGAFQVASDGMVVQDGTPVARLALIDISDPRAATRVDGGFFAAPGEATTRADAATVRQGAIESSNVSTADEMVALMEAVRRAETGQRIIGTYDDLMGRALSAFGQP